MDDRAKFYHDLRASTAALLNYDLNKLTLQQSLKVDLAASLRLEIDRITAAQLAGESVDLRELVLASESLSRLVAPTSDLGEVKHDFDGAFEHLSLMLSDRADRLRTREASVSEALRQEIAELKAKLAGATSSPPIGADASATPTPAAPQITSNQPPLPPPNAGVPAHYLADHSQPWRVVEGGASLPPPGSNRSRRTW
jgi:hypothetical protein